HWGADLMAGSLIKNMGAGIVPGGGYIVGKEELVERAACRLTVPGAGREMGASLVSNRCFFQALFMAPQIVKGAVFASSFLDSLGFELSPLPYEERHDIIQAIKMKDAKQLIAFCQGVQKYSPINSFAVPEPSPLPGYDSEIIMAAGTFVQGSTIELSADAPLREPYTLYMQGGLNRYHVKYALINTAYDMAEAGLL
ncbi:MAG: methionine gamma-lyase family protein, partial [Clostridiales bacterium]